MAAHLEPEILVVDEVLAVGDAAFQEKCLGKMQGVAGEGRTVLFVSHNMASLQQLCTRAMLMKDGRVQREGHPAAIVGDYLADSHPVSTHDLRNWTDRTGSGEARVVRLTVTDRDGTLAAVSASATPSVSSFDTEFTKPLVDPNFGVVIHGSSGEPLLDPESIHNGLRLGRVDGRFRIKGTVANLGLSLGDTFAPVDHRRSRPAG